MSRALATAAVLLALCGGAAKAGTLEFTMPTVNTAGDTLTGYLRYEVAFTTQSKTWVAKHVVMLANADSFTVHWPAVRAEYDQRVVLTGYALAGSFVSIPQPAVSSLDWPAFWWVRAWTGSPGGWSNPVRYVEP